MTNLEFLLNQREWCNTMLAKSPANLPGTLTHDKVAKLAIDTECELVEYERYSAEGKLKYADNVQHDQ